MTIGDLIEVIEAKFHERLYKARLKFIDWRLRMKYAVPVFLTWLETLDLELVCQKIRNIFLNIRPFVKETPSDLALWTTAEKGGRIRLTILFVFLAVVFAMAGSSYDFLANDAFVSFRYVANAVEGHGYTFNPPPFEPVNGYTSFLWLFVLKVFWSFGIKPPFSANFLTYAFSMGTVWLGFSFIRRMPMLAPQRAKSLYIFLIFCLVLLTNRTFLAFMSSGTEAAMFNFLAVWWAYAATSKNIKPFQIAVISVLLALARPEGLAFVVPTFIFLTVDLIKTSAKKSALWGFLALSFLWFYYDWQKRVYGQPFPLYLTAIYDKPAFAIGKAYLLSFILEYALYIWAVFFGVWFFFKIIIKKQSGLPTLLLMWSGFALYAGWYVFIIGGDVLEYRPFGMFIPLFTLAAIRAITENINKNFYFLCVCFAVYFLFALPIPYTHRTLTQDLTTRRETQFLYRPVSAKAGFFVLFSNKWDDLQKFLIYQGVGLRHQEHKVLTDLMLASFPDRKTGKRLKPEKDDDNYLFAWDFVGVPAWTLPYTYIIDTSGRNNKLIAYSPLKFGKRRLFDHDRTTPTGYVSCFNGGTNIKINPFAGRKNMSVNGTRLSVGKIKGCENFWKNQFNLLRKSKEIPKLKEK